MNPVKGVILAVGHWFESFWKGISGQLKASAEDFFMAFVKDDLGQLAIDAVEFIADSMPGATDVEKRNAAVAKFIEDAGKAGKDVTTFAVSTLNWFIETALQAVHSGVGR